MTDHIIVLVCQQPVTLLTNFKIQVIYIYKKKRGGKALQKK